MSARTQIYIRCINCLHKNPVVLEEPRANPSHLRTLELKYFRKLQTSRAGETLPLSSFENRSTVFLLFQSGNRP